MTNVCGTGSWNGPKPGDPDNNSILTATPAFGGIDVAWSYPELNPHAVAHTILYRGITAEINGAFERAVVSGNFFYDKLDSDQEYFYWIRIVSVNGTEGELIGPASATARPLIEDLLEQLTEKIDQGVLAQSLKGTLDQISLLNTNLLAEIFDRENGETSLAQALADAQTGIASSLAFIAQEINTRTSADAAMAEAIDLVAVTLGDDFAAVTTSMSTVIDGVTGAIDAMYTAKVTVNGLIGGFGIHNDGDQVDAGFDVDTFWVGRTSADKRKPFIIVDGETFIDQAVINELTFSKLRDEAGTFIVESGRIKAAYLRVQTASIDDAAITNAKIGNVIQSNNFVWGSAGWYLDKSGYLQVNNIYARGDIQATSITADTIYTHNIVGGAVSSGYVAVGGSSTVSFYCPAGASSISISTSGAYAGGGGLGETDPYTYPVMAGITVNGVNVNSAPGICTWAINNPPEGVYTISGGSANGSAMTTIVQLNRR